MCCLHYKAHIRLLIFCSFRHICFPTPDSDQCITLCLNHQTRLKPAQLVSFLLSVPRFITAWQKPNKLKLPCIFFSLSSNLIQDPCCLDVFRWPDRVCLLEKRLRLTDDGGAETRWLITKILNSFNNTFHPSCEQFVISSINQAGVWSDYTPAVSTQSM